MEDAITSQRAIVFFLWKENTKTSETATHLENVFGVHSMNKSTVYDWVQHFSKARASLKDNDREGRPELNSENT